MSTISKNKVFVVALISFLFASGLFFYLYHRVSAINAHIGVLEDEVAQNGKREDQLRSLKALFADTAPQRSKVNTYFIGSDGVVPFLERLEALGKETGVSLEVNSVGVDPAVNPHAALESVPVTLSFSGSFNGVMRFINLVEKIPIPGEVSVLRLDRTGDEKGSAWKASITARFSKIK